MTTCHNCITIPSFFYLFTNLADKHFVVNPEDCCLGVLFVCVCVCVCFCFFFVSGWVEGVTDLDPNNLTRMIF